MMPPAAEVEPAATSATSTATSAESASAHPASAAAPWKPVFDQADDLDGLLTARSPLLSRAFGRRDRTPPS